MFILLTLLLFCTLTYAADDRRDLIPFSSSSSSYSNAMSLSASSSTDALKTPEDYLQQLARDSAALEKNPLAGEHNFVFDINNEDIDDIELLPKIEKYIESLSKIERYINNHFPTLQEYLPYFIALAQNRSLSDSKKIQKKYVYVPPIAQLNTQADKDEKLRQAMLIHNDYNYSIRRLLFAALIHAGSSPNLKAKLMLSNHNISFNAALYKDISLLQNIVNSPTFDPAKHARTFSVVESCQITQLLIEKKVKLPDKIDFEHPLVLATCSNRKVDTDLINAYLKHILRTEERENGQLYLKEIVRFWKNSYRQADLRAKIIKLFLMNDYLYDDALKADIIETIVNCEENIQKKDNVREQIIELFAQHEDKNTKPAHNK